MEQYSVLYEPLVAWAYSMFNQMAAVDGRLMFLGGLASSFVITQLLMWITSNALRMAVIVGVIGSAGAGIASVLPDPGRTGPVAAPQAQAYPDARQNPAQVQAPIRLTPPTQGQVQGQPIPAKQPAPMQR